MEARWGIRIERESLVADRSGGKEDETKLTFMTKAVMKHRAKGICALSSRRCEGKEI